MSIKAEVKSEKIITPLLLIPTTRQNPLPTKILKMKAVAACILLVLAVGANAGYGKIFREEALVKSYGGYEHKKFVPIVKLLGSSDNYGNYNFDSESADGSKFAETGSLKLIGDKVGAVKTGQFSWISPEGEHVSLAYTADENGYHPVGSHIPKVDPALLPTVTRVKVLPEIVETEEVIVRSHPRQHHIRHRLPVVREHIAPVTVFTDELLPVQPLKTIVDTPEYSIHSEPSKTFVRIGH